MWIRHQRFDNRKCEAAGSDGSAAAGGASGDASSSGDGNATGGENNTGGNNDPFATMWNDPAAGGDAGDANANANAQPTVAPATRTPQEVFDEHFDSLSIGAGFDMQQVTQDIQNGGVEQLSNFANVLAKDIYKAAITQSSKIMDSKIVAAVDAAVNKSSGEFNATLATNELNTALPFTADAAIKPVADGVFSRFIKAGKSVPEAIELTKGYFEHTFKLAGKSGLNTGAPSSQPGAGRFGASGGNPQGADDENEPDWAEILGGG